MLTLNLEAGNPLRVTDGHEWLKTAAAITEIENMFIRQVQVMEKQSGQGDDGNSNSGDAAVVEEDDGMDIDGDGNTSEVDGNHQRVVFIQGPVSPGTSNESVDAAPGRIKRKQPSYHDRQEYGYHRVAITEDEYRILKPNSKQRTKYSEKGPDGVKHVVLSNNDYRMLYLE